MKTTLSVKFQSEFAEVWMNFVMLILAVLWVALLLNSATPGIAFGIKLWVVVAALVLIVQGRRQSVAIASGARVFSQLRTPQRFWRAWLGGSLADSMRVWGWFTAGGTLLQALPTSPWQWPTAAAIFSVTLCLSTIAALSSQGLLHFAGVWVILVGGALSAIGIVLMVGIASAADQFGQSPIILQGLLALSWPLMAYALLAGWQKTPALDMAAYLTKGSGWRKRLAGQAHRYTLLEYYKPVLPPGGLSQSSPLPILREGLFQSLWIFLAAQLNLFASWHSRIGPSHLLGLGFLMLYTGAMVVCKDLHWRHLLAPGTWQRGRLAWHLFGTSLALQCICYSFWAAVWTFFSWAWFDVSLIHNLESAWKYRILPLEVVAATGFSVLLRGTGRLSAPVFVATLLMMSGVMFWSFGFSDWPKWIPVDSTYAISLLVASLLSICVANRLWTVKKLQPFLRLR